MRRARGGTLRSPAPIAYSTCSARASCWCATARRQLRAFYNVCRHRGSRLCREAPRCTPARRRCSAAVSPAGSHHLPVSPVDLRSRRATRRRALPQRCSRASTRTLFSLYPVGARVLGWFRVPQPDARRRRRRSPRSSARSRRVSGAIRSRELRIGHTIRYEVAANWKVICENYNECYHCAGVHPELCAVVPAFRTRGGAHLDWLRGIPHRPGAYTFTQLGHDPAPRLPGPEQDERVRHKGELDLSESLPESRLRPRGGRSSWSPRAPCAPRSCAISCSSRTSSPSADFDARDASDFWDLVNRQDWAICERCSRASAAACTSAATMRPWRTSISTSAATCWNGSATPSGLRDARAAARTCVGRDTAPAGALEDLPLSVRLCPDQLPAAHQHLHRRRADDGGARTERAAASRGCSTLGCSATRSCSSPAACSVNASARA